MPEEASQLQTPYRQIRAAYNDDTVIVYQAYSAAIASAAVQHQRLNASPAFSPTRMTWIKPSWCWAMYRSGYSLKDPNQARILALQISHSKFQALLSQAVVTHSHGGALTAEEKARPVRVQWDPERGPRLQVLGYRSIQIGIDLKSVAGKAWLEEGIESIEDVTEQALELKRVVDEEPELGVEKLVERGLVPVEKEYVVPKELRKTLKMDLNG
jgi:Domain of unknown function (DUF4291)